MTDVPPNLPPAEPAELQAGDRVRVVSEGLAGDVRVGVAVRDWSNLAVTTHIIGKPASPESGGPEPEDVEPLIADGLHGRPLGDSELRRCFTEPEPTEDRSTEGSAETVGAAEFDAALINRARSLLAEKKADSHVELMGFHDCGDRHHRVVPSFVPGLLRCSGCDVQMNYMQVCWYGDSLVAVALAMGELLDCNGAEAGRMVAEVLERGFQMGFGR